MFGHASNVQYHFSELILPRDNKITFKYKQSYYPKYKFSSWAPVRCPGAVSFNNIRKSFRNNAIGLL